MVDIRRGGQDRGQGSGVRAQAQLAGSLGLKDKCDLVQATHLPQPLSPHLANSYDHNPRSLVEGPRKSGA